MRLFILLSASLTAFSCARAIRLPTMDAPPVVGQFEGGVNQRTRVFEFEVPEVKKGTQVSKSLTLKFGGAQLGGGKNQVQPSTVTVLRAGQPLAQLECLSEQGGVIAGRRDESRHAFSCVGNGFSLRVDEPQKDVFHGSAQVGPVALDIVSTDDMAEGIAMYPTGFHLTSAGRWVASFEYFQSGKVYLRPDLSGPERDAVLAAAVVIQSTDRWMAHNLEQNQSRPFGM